MAYTVIRTVYRLVFPERAGMEVRAKAVSVAQLLDMSAFGDLAAIDPDHVTPEDVARIRELFELFTRYLIDWNLETEESEPIPCTLEGLLSLELALAFEIVFAWMEAVADIPDPKGTSLPGGSPSLEASIPMVVLSESQAS